MAVWQSGHAAACKAVYAGSIPASAFSLCPGGETGRRKGLKIPRRSNSMPVRFRPWAPIIFLDETLWPNMVNDAKLLDPIVCFINTYIVAEPEIVQAAALWIVFTWLTDVVNVAPLAANMGSVPMFRLVDQSHQTLLIHEHYHP
jgi:hypothetical protein